MYFIPKANDRTQQAGLRGFAQPRDTSQHQRSLDAILRALQLNPVGGFVKGSSARRQLEEAFLSVPPTSALELFNQLGKGESPLGRLFRYRLHYATRVAMLAILESRIADLKVKQSLEEALKLFEGECARLQEMKKVVEKICRSQGDDSDQCQKARFLLLEAKMKLDDAIRRFRGRPCP